MKPLDFTFKKLNNNNKPTKIRCTTLPSNDKGWKSSIIISVRVLINDTDDYFMYKRTGFNTIKRYKNVILMDHTFAIQLETFAFIYNIVFNQLIK